MLTINGHKLCQTVGEVIEALEMYPREMQIDVFRTMQFNLRGIEIKKIDVLDAGGLHDWMDEEGKYAYQEWTGCPPVTKEIVVLI